MVVASVEDPTDASGIAGVVDAFEVRLDRICHYGGDPLQVLNFLYDNYDTPIFATIRRDDASNEWNRYVADENRREALFQHLLGHASLVDVEIDSPHFARMMSLASEHGVKKLASYHNYERTDEKAALNEIVRRLLVVQPDVMKVACQAESREDTITMLEFLVEYLNNQSAKCPISVISSGPQGCYTRIFFPYLGSCVAYGVACTLPRCYDRGQVSIGLLRRIFTEIPPSKEIRDTSDGLRFELHMNNILTQAMTLTTR